jgi:hypothetical protein
MPKENDRAGERQACEIGGAPLIPCDESSIVLEPGKEPLDFPAARVSTQGAPILGEMDPIGAMRGGESAELPRSTFCVSVREFSSRRARSCVVVEGLMQCQRSADSHPDALPVPPAATL